jgi:hypothetical protein
VTERSSPLNQRLRRLLGTGSLSAPPAPIAETGRPRDTGLLFESQITRLSQALIDLRTIDQQRETELCTLREQIGLVQIRTQVALNEIDALITLVERQVVPAPPADTLFERMRARSATAALSSERRTELLEWAAALRRVRAQLRAIIE